MTLTQAATLFGPEDLRIVETEMSPLAEGMVRIRFGAGGICGSDMHYFRHARTGDFVVRDPLILGHEVAGVIAEVNAPGSGLACRRPGRGQSFALLPQLRALPRRPAEFVREHLFHGLGQQISAYAGRLRGAVRRDTRAMRQGAGRHVHRGGRARRAAVGLPACGGAWRRSGRQIAAWSSAPGLSAC